MTHTISRLIASFALVVAIGIEFFHTFVSHAPWRGFSPAFNASSYVLIPLWILAIAGLWTDRALSKFCVALGLILAAAQGVDIAVSGDQQGQALTYLLCAVVAVGCCVMEYLHYEAESRAVVTVIPLKEKRIA
jgi:hypothetical protein